MASVSAAMCRGDLAGDLGSISTLGIWALVDFAVFLLTSESRGLSVLKFYPGNIPGCHLGPLKQS